MGVRMTIYLNTPIPNSIDYLGVDTETTGLDPHINRLLSVSFSDGKDVWIFLHFHGLGQLKDILEDKTCVKLFHNAKFDLKWLKKHLNISVHNIYDTMLAEQVIDGDRGNLVALDEVLARRLGILMSKEVRQTFENHPGFIKQPVTDEQILYMAEDVLHLPALREHQLKDIVKDKLVKVVQLEFDAVPGFMDIELNGYVLDVDLWYQQVKQFDDLIQQHDQRMRELIGSNYVLSFMNKSIKNPKRKTYSVDKINFGSNDQLRHIMNDRFKIKTPDTNDKTLEKLLKQKHSKEGLEFIREIQEVRKWKKRKGYNYPKYIHPVTGKIHPDIHQIGAGTGRTSVSDPNMQQVPKPEEDKVEEKPKPNMRNLFIPDDLDYVLLRVDYGQQEPRVMAQLCGDPAMLKACNEKDVYIEFAKPVYKETISKSDPRRFLIKTGLLGIAYQSGLETTMASTGLDREQAEAFRSAVKGTFPIMASYADRTKHMVEIYGYVMTASGRRRYFDRKKNFFTEAVNAPVQGTSADMFKIAFARTHNWITEQKQQHKLAPMTRVWNIVHDEIVIQCHKDEVELVSQEVVKIMEQAGKELCPDVLHVAEPSWSYRWDK